MAQKTTRKRKPQPPRHLSPELTAIVGAPESNRGEALKKVWAYIKSHNLQDPQNKRRIIPDDTLAKLFGTSDPIDMFKIAGIVSKHMGK